MYLLLSTNFVKMACAAEMLDRSESLLDCSICFEHYDDNKHAPIMFVLQHTVCKVCLVDLIEAHATDGEFPCPICREAMEIKPEGVDGYAKNLLLMNILCHKKPQEKQEIKCQEHRKRTASNYCMTCMMGLCPKCMVCIAKGEMHSGHEIEDMEDTHARKNKELAWHKTWMNEFIDQAERLVVENKKLHDSFKEAKEQITKLADEAVAKVRDEQRKLEDELDCLYKDVIAIKVSDGKFLQGFGRLDETNFEKKYEEINEIKQMLKKVFDITPKDFKFISEDDFRKAQHEMSEQLQALANFVNKLQRTFKVIPKPKPESPASVQLVQQSEHIE